MEAYDLQKVIRCIDKVGFSCNAYAALHCSNVNPQLEDYFKYFKFVSAYIWDCEKCQLFTKEILNI